MPRFLVLTLGNATEDSLVEAAQSAFCKIVEADDIDAAISEYVAERDQEGNYYAVPLAEAGQRTPASVHVERESNLNITKE